MYQHARVDLQVAMKVCPSKDNFFRLLKRDSEDVSDEDIAAQMTTYNQHLTRALSIIQDFYDSNNLDA